MDAMSAGDSLVASPEACLLRPVTSQLPMMAMASRDKAESTPVEAGELKVRIDINGLYELGR